MLKAECSPQRWSDTKHQNTGFLRNNYPLFTAQLSIANTSFSVTFWVCSINKLGGVPLLVYRKELFHNECFHLDSACDPSRQKQSQENKSKSASGFMVTWFLPECLGLECGLCLSNNQIHLKSSLVLIDSLLTLWLKAQVNEFTIRTLALIVKINKPSTHRLRDSDFLSRGPL